ncbi:acetyl-CoA C-acyltransferase [Rhodococcus sp. AD45-ID]|jgi:acetyl-CoA C-acetyltransferase|uniref:acetyl-CoA C-acetyltransferase n=1 Tax=Rhodococcus TaxID=1827 RepID=UPI0005D42F18|nr:MULTISPECIES: acetyl-CoA C-acetyltransferase [Rhodococcus]KJF24149.1 Beta-ketothiolase BktB [Rhodococcus sp. AD45]MCE4265679.1 acetyl-CoA C-acetyltransferase [Rhodococcus globerulus]PSR42478.1 acetyl-CoA C-acyltransferase [Rhodococcus sp. AD45-ID]QXV99973.1 acetyl-CoA C-acetyltransferase [Rhodococcus globerulus]
MYDAVICEPVRTPVGGFGGVFKDVPVTTLAATVMRGLIERTGLQSADIDDVVFGQGYANGEAAAIGRIAALDAGLDISVPGIQLDRRCGSGLQAIIYAAMQVQTGMSDLVIAGGAESMSGVEFYSNDIRWGTKKPSVEFHDRLAKPRTNSGGVNFPVEGGMIETAENLRREYAISRDEQDRYALRSHERAVNAQDKGYFDEEIIPVTVPSRRGDAKVVTQDEHPRRDVQLSDLAALRPLRSRVDPDATVTAGNACGQNDGGAAAIVTTPANAERLGLRPFAKLVSWGVTGVEPNRMGIGPVSAVAKALSRVDLQLSDIDLIEVNEAFAAQVLACARAWGLSETDLLERFNVNGSGISLGHPVGATGGRILANLLRELDRRQGRYGIESMCIGGGQGIAAVFENLRR